MDLEQVKSMLAGRGDLNIEVHQTLPSTNTYLFNLAKDKRRPWTIAVADTQSAGKGRSTRRWDSPSGVGLWFSILLQPDISVRSLNLINLLVSYSFAVYLESTAKHQYETDIRIDLKWPNDLLVNGKKICGILLEASFSGESLGYLVVGLGLNVNQKIDDFPPEIQETATSLKLISGLEWDRAALLSGFLLFLQQQLEKYVPARLSEIVDLYRSKVLFMGEEIVASQGPRQHKGIFRDVNPDGYMVLEEIDGVRLITTGDIFRLAERK